MVCHGSQFYSTLQEWQDSRNGIYNLIFKLDKRTDGVMNVNIKRTTYEVWKNTDQIFSLMQVLQQKAERTKMKTWISVCALNRLAVFQTFIFKIIGDVHQLRFVILERYVRTLCKILDLYMARETFCTTHLFALHFVTTLKTKCDISVVIQISFDIL